MLLKKFNDGRWSQAQLLQRELGQRRKPLNRFCFVLSIWEVRFPEENISGRGLGEETSLHYCILDDIYEALGFIILFRICVCVCVSDMKTKQLFWSFFLRAIYLCLTLDSQPDPLHHSVVWWVSLCYRCQKWCRQQELSTFGQKWRRGQTLWALTM